LRLIFLKAVLSLYLFINSAFTTTLTEEKAMAAAM